MILAFFMDDFSTNGFFTNGGGGRGMCLEIGQMRLEKHCMSIIKLNAVFCCK